LASQSLSSSGEQGAQRAFVRQRALPNFLVIGAAKSGTTSLYEYLRQHPQVYMSPRKETHFLIYECKMPRACDVGPDPVKTWDEYHAQFAGVTNEIAIGEASPGYLCDPDVPRQVERLLPGARVIAILRNPVDRAYSSFTKAIALGEEPLRSFGDAIPLEAVHEEDPWEGGRRYLRQGLYHQQLSRYFETLDPARIKVVLFDDLERDAVSVMREIYAFLGVDAGFRPNVEQRHNQTVMPRSRRLDLILRRPSGLRRMLRAMLPAAIWEKARARVERIKSWNTGSVPEMTPAVRRQLIEFYREDIQKLGILIGRDLSHWC